ncbi:hypothetical protein IW261DRAFT_1425690 [Armillaria novae-zelandiae]|uniref:Uncharacterized protein n=1 Tax=Armillaria novae-zelandiae TaxID=153914 RepID=A0AA39NSL3_9AGAR|nr:hypothetical protein IW261DRAFT_1425690 [Armillaria novae-zelandiae]
MNAHLTISHKEISLYEVETTPPRLKNYSTDVRLASAPEARKLPLAMETRGEEGRRRVHVGWRGSIVEPRLRGGDGRGFFEVKILMVAVEADKRASGLTRRTHMWCSG